jgi:hypothetical protein
MSSAPESTTPGDAPKSLFRAFDRQFFVKSEAWSRLSDILTTNGGPYALAGPRGAGKSWLMLRALDEAKRQGGLTLWYPSPSNYSAFEFLSTLSDNFANQIERRYRPDRYYPTLTSSPWRVAAGVVLLTIGLVLGFRLRVSDEVLRTFGLLLFLAATGGCFGLLLRNALRIGRQPEDGDPGRRTSRDGTAPRQPSGLPLLGPKVLPVLVAGFAGAVAGLGLGYLGVSEFGTTDTELRGMVLVGIALALGFVMLVTTALGVARERRPEQLLTREAGLLRERIRYSSRTRQAGELSGGAAAYGLRAGLKASREKELVERPTTVASLIHDFRALAERAAAVSGRVVIAIDELDKMTDASAVRALLRNIKGIFEIKGVFFLVSVSDEATRSLKLGGVAGRDEFNSSFYAVIDVPPMTSAFLSELLGRRKTPLDPRVGQALSLLAGRNPRETLRLADAILRAGRAGDVTAAVAAAMQTEARAFRANAMSSTAPGWPDGLAEDERRRLADLLADERFGADGFADVAHELFGEWAPSWAGKYFSGHLQREWRRLLVRLRVAGHLVDDEADSETLGVILAALEESPEVAERALLTYERARLAAVR